MMRVNERITAQNECFFISMCKESVEVEKSNKKQNPLNSV